MRRRYGWTEILRVILRIMMTWSSSGIISTGRTSGMDHSMFQGQQNVCDAFSIDVARSRSTFSSRATPTASNDICKIFKQVEHVETKVGLKVLTVLKNNWTFNNPVTAYCYYYNTDEFTRDFLSFVLRLDMYRNYLNSIVILENYKVGWTQRFCYFICETLFLNYININWILFFLVK